jgi:hypothetical protein
MKKILLFLLLTQLSSSYIQLFDVIPIKFIPSTNFFCTDLDSEDFYIYVECSKNMKIPNGIYVPKVWNFSYISENPEEKNKALDIQCELYGDEDSHHMICKLTKKFSLFNLKGPFKRPLIWEKKDFYFTYEGEVYQSRVDNNNYGYIYRYLGHTKEKKMLSIPIKDGKNSFNYTYDKPPYFLSYEFKENLYDYYSPIIVTDMSNEIPCNIVNQNNVECYFTPKMIPASDDAISAIKIYLKNPCNFNDETPFSMYISNGDSYKRNYYPFTYNIKKPFIKRLFDLNKKSK